MRTKEFQVPTDIIIEFSDALAEHELGNEIMGTTEEGEVIISVTMKKKKAQRCLL
jgi:hypothetical protein